MPIDIGRIRNIFVTKWIKIKMEPFGVGSIPKSRLGSINAAT